MKIFVVTRHANFDSWPTAVFSEREYADLFVSMEGGFPTLTIDEFEVDEELMGYESQPLQKPQES